MAGVMHLITKRGQRKKSMDVTGAVKAAEAVDKAVGIVAKLVGKLKAKPDLAAQKLAQALGEVGKTLQVVENVMTEFLSLGIDTAPLTKNSKLLLEIDGGSLTTEVNRGRGHCHTIWHIYRTYLDKWFDRAFAGDDNIAMKRVFRDLGDADNTLFADLEKVASMLEEEGGEVLSLVTTGKEAEARNRVLAMLPVLRPLRKTMSRTMQTLYSLRSDFIDIAGAV